MNLQNRLRSVSLLKAIPAVSVTADDPLNPHHVTIRTETPSDFFLAARVDEARAGLPEPNWRFIGGQTLAQPMRQCYFTLRYQISQSLNHHLIGEPS